MSKTQEPVAYRVFDMTKTSHKTPYAAISPSKPSLSQVGKTVLITGASGGIGLEIARVFGEAGAEKVIIVGRDGAKVGSVAEQLNKENQGSGTVFEGRTCQISDPDSIDKLWDTIEAESIKVDVIVLNAAMTDQFGNIEGLGWKNAWKAFEINVRSYHQFCDRLHENAKSQGGKKYIVNVSTSAIHDFPAASYAPSYALTKNSATLLLQQLAREWKVSDVQIVSFHPGALLTPGARSLGLDETSFAWDDIRLPASVALWAASEEASFLHGRFIWARWDVEELASGEIRERLESDDKFLRIGVHGLEQPKGTL